jgi:hypothetical protein
LRDDGFVLGRLKDIKFDLRGLLAGASLRDDLGLQACVSLTIDGLFSLLTFGALIVIEALGMRDVAM